MNTPKNLHLPIYRTHQALLSLLVLCISGCSFFDTDIFSSSSPSTPGNQEIPGLSRSRVAPEPQDLAKVPIQKFESPEDKNKGSVELVWKIPSQPIDGYILHYGFSREDLPEEIKISGKAIEKYEDPQHGFVYRYVLNGVPKNRNIFLNLSAIRGDNISAPGNVMEIEAEKIREQVNESSPTLRAPNTNPQE